MMRTNREEIQYHQRKFKYSLSGEDIAANFVFDLQPPNEFAFSDRYSQCLIKINHAYLSNRGDTVNHGLDAVFMDGAGLVELMTCGCLMMTDIRTNNFQSLSTNIGVVAPPVGVGGFQTTLSGIHAVLHNSGGSVSSAGNFKGAAIEGATSVTRGFAAAGAAGIGAQQNTHNVNMWEYRDDRSIEVAGTLCPNPFGKKMNIELFSIDSGNRVLMTSLSNLGVAASNGSSLNVELEILMLPNPTPDDP